MQTVTTEFNRAAKTTARNPKAKLDFVWTDQYLDSSVTVSTNDDNRLTKNNQVHDGNLINNKKWAHIDGVLKANSERYVASGSTGTSSINQVGWYGATRSNGSAEWSTDPQLTMEFDARPILMLTVVGDYAYEEYPVDFNIKLYAGAVLEHTEAVTGNTDIHWYHDVTSDNLINITKMILTIEKWSHVNRVVKIVEFYTPFLMTFESDDIASIRLLEERTIGDGSIPIGNISANEVDIKLQNISIDVNGTDVVDPFFPANVNSYFYTFLSTSCRQKVTPYIGFVLEDDSIEYVRMGTFWLTGWNINEQDATVSATGRDRMELLRKAIYKGSTMYTNTTLYALLIVLLVDARDNIPMTDLQWQVDSELKDFTLSYGWLPEDNYFKLIKKIVESCMGQAYMSRDDILIIEGPSALTG